MPGARQLEIIRVTQSLPELVKLANPKLFPLPCPVLPGENTPKGYGLCLPLGLASASSRASPGGPLCHGIFLLYEKCKL